MAHTPYNPTINLLCQKCRRQTPHLATGFSNDPLSALTLTYECQLCGEIKKVFDLNTLPELKVPASNEGEWREREPEPREESHEEPDTQAIPIEKGPQIES